MKNYLYLLLGVGVLSVSPVVAQTIDPSLVITKEVQQKMTPEEALQRLKDGNQRFLEDKMVHRDFREQAKTTSTGQFPYATILGCQDSRTSSEILFDMSKGDAFHLRVAGNVVNDDILGGMEFGTKVTGTKVLVVMGHTSCGAIRGAIDHVELGNLTTLLWKIQPSIEDVDASVTPRTAANAAFVNKVAEANVRTMMNLVKAKSVVIAEQLKNKEIIMVGAMCDIETGKVTFLED